MHSHAQYRHIMWLTGFGKTLETFLYCWKRLCVWMWVRAIFCHYNWHFSCYLENVLSGHRNWMISDVELPHLSDVKKIFCTRTSWLLHLKAIRLSIGHSLSQNSLQPVAEARKSLSLGSCVSFLYSVGRSGWCTFIMLSEWEQIMVSWYLWPGGGAVVCMFLLHNQHRS